MSPNVARWNSGLRLLFAGTVVFQTAIILACVAMEYANAKAGLLQYRLPQSLFWTYLAVGTVAPGLALATLAVLWAKRASVWPGISDTDRRALRHLVALCAVNVCAVAVWFVFAGRVFFGAGGNR